MKFVCKHGRKGPCIDCDPNLIEFLIANRKARMKFNEMFGQGKESREKYFNRREADRSNSNK